MTVTAETPAQGTWARRPGHTAHLDNSGAQDMDVAFSHDSETGVPTVRMNGAATIRLVMNGRTLPNPPASQMDDLRTELADLEVAAEGGSNDEEIEALRVALDSALALLGLTREQ